MVGTLRETILPSKKIRKIFDLAIRQRISYDMQGAPV
jgi:hypothetical protein